MPATDHHGIGGCVLRRLLLAPLGLLMLAPLGLRHWASTSTQSILTHESVGQWSASRRAARADLRWGSMVNDQSRGRPIDRRRFLGQSSRLALLAGLALPALRPLRARASGRHRADAAAGAHRQPGDAARQRLLADRQWPRARDRDAEAVQLRRLHQPRHHRRVRGQVRRHHRVLHVRHRGAPVGRARQRLLHVRRGRGRHHAQPAARRRRQPHPAAQPRLPHELREHPAVVAGPLLRPRLEVHDSLHRVHHRRRLPPRLPRRLAVRRRRLVEGAVGPAVPGLRRRHRRRSRRVDDGDVLPRRVRHEHRRSGDHRPGRERPARPDQRDERPPRHPRLPEDPRRHVAREPGVERRHAGGAAVPARGHRPTRCSATGRPTARRWPTTSR